MVAVSRTRVIASFAPSNRARLVAVLVPTAIALVLCSYQLTLPYALTGIHEYDDGVNLGASLRLVSGDIPYSDFALMQPPGISLLMTPFALLGQFVGTHTALIVARVATVFVAAANVALTALCVRHRGPGAMALAGVVLACWPLAVAATKTVMFEPYLVFFCLLAMFAMFSDGHPAGHRRLMLAGAALGFATVVNLWGSIVAIVALVVCLPRRENVLAVAKGIAVGFGVPCLPFVLLAPGNFLHQVFALQLPHIFGDIEFGGRSDRLTNIIGTSGLTFFHATPALALTVFLLVVGGVVFVFGRKYRELTRFDAMAVACYLAILCMLFAQRDLWTHFTYFAAPFLAVIVATALAISSQSLSTRSSDARSRHRDQPPPAWRRLVGSQNRLLAAIAGALVLFLVPQQLSYAKTVLAKAFDPGATIRAAIPPGSCVVFDQAITAIVSDRFTSRRPCPADVDPLATWLDKFPAHPPPYAGPDKPPELTSLWVDWFSQADYVLQIAPRSSFIPWTPILSDWFSRQYAPVSTEPRAHVSRNTAPPLR